MMGRRGVGMRPRLVGAKGNNFSHFSLSYACFPLSYTCFFIILHLFFHYPTPVFHYPTPVFSLSYACFPLSYTCFPLSYTCFFIILRPKKSYNSKINLHNSKKSSIFAPQLIHGEYILIQQRYKPNLILWNLNTLKGLFKHSLCAHAARRGLLCIHLNNSVSSGPQRIK